MAINAKDYIAKLTPAEQQAIRAHAEEMIAEEMNLAQLREALKRSQAEIAEKCGIKQAAISRLERRDDARVSTLRKLAEAMGGTLEIIVRFPDRRPVQLSQFESQRRNRASLSGKGAPSREECILSLLRGLAAKFAGPKRAAPLGEKTKRAKTSGGTNL